MSRNQIARPCAAFAVIAAICVVIPLAVSQDRPPARDDRAELVRTEEAYPTGDRATSVILLERFTPAEVRANTVFEYQIRLTNLTRAEVRDIVLTERFPANFRAQDTAPHTAFDRDGRAAWKWSRLAPGQSTEIIRVRGSTDRVAPLSLCGTVTFSEPFCATVNVVEPKIALTKSAPREVLLCDPIPMRLVVSNPGSGILRNVRVLDTLPPGLVTADGRSSVVFDAGDLPAGQAREFTLTAKASKTGEYRNSARAADDSGLTADASAITIVRQPVLTITKRGPELRYIGRTATFDITVQNVGDAPARDAVLTDALPPGTDLVSADGGQVADGRVVWNLGTLAPQASRTVKLTLKPNQIGVIRNTATVQAYCASASAAASLEIRGIPAILLELVDDPDPIEVGGPVTYRIEVTNQGTAYATNIVIDCLLPDGLKYVSANGPTAGALNGQNVRFAPLGSLAPKARTTYTVVANGAKEGDHRFKTTLTCDQTTSSVDETESTHVY